MKSLVRNSLVILALLASGCDVMQQALHLVPRDGIYLMPNGYAGVVIILYDQPDGVVPEVEDGHYVYKIPPSGVLKVRTPPYLGTIDVKYFYTDQSGQRREIKYITLSGDRNPQGRPKNKYGDLSSDEIENGIFVINRSGYGEFKAKGKAIHFSKIIIGKPKDSEKLADEYQKKIVEVQNEIQSGKSLAERAREK